MHVREARLNTIHGITYFSSVSMACIPQIPSYGDSSIKGKSQTDGLQINPACVACSA